MEHSNGQNVQLSSCLTLWTVKWLKSKAKKDLVLINQRRTRMRYDTSLFHIFWKHGPEDCRSTILSPARNPMQIWSNFIQLYPSLFSNILMYMEKLILMDIAQKIIWNAYEQTQKLIRHLSLINPDEYPDEHQHFDEEHSNILMFILGTQQHSDDQNVHPDFQVKACGAQDTWHNTIGHPTTAIWVQKLYK